MKQKLPLLLLLLLAVWGARAQAPTWQSALSSTAVDVRAVATNAAGDVFVTGSFTGTVTFGPNTLNSSSPDADMFVAKWAAGASTWAWAASGGGGTPGDAGDANDMGNAIAVNGNRVYVAGQFRSATAFFGSTSLTNGGLNDMFVARFTDNTTSVTTVGARGSSNAAASDLAYGLAVNPTNGNVYVTGYFGGSASLTATISGSALTSAGSADVYVAKYLDNGSGLTNGGATRAGGTSSEVATCLALNGNTLYVGGRFNSGTAVFGSSSLTNVVTTNLFVARFTDTTPTATGGVTANNAVSGGGNDGTEGVQGIAVSGSSVYVTGRMASTTAGIAGSTLTNAAALAFDHFVAKYTDNGTALTNGYAVRDGGTGNENNSPFGNAGISVSGTSVYVASDFDATATIAGTGLTNLGGTDVYVAKYTDTGSTLSGSGALRGGGTGNDASYGLAVNGTQGVVGGTTTTPSNFGTALATGSSFAARLSFGLPPTVTTNAAGSIATTSAVLGGNVTADGGATVTDRGVVYSSSATTPAIGGTGVTQAPNGAGTGTFSATISGLAPSTTYYVRAYATNSAGTSYGSVQTFTTQAIAVATAQNVTVQLAANGTATLNASSVNNGSTGSGTLTYTIQKIAFGKVNENSTLTLTTPNGANFTAIRFASYGTPLEYSNGNYGLGSCNAANSVATATNAYVGRSSGSMYASNTDTRNNPVLNDPCGGTPKFLAVQAAYSADAASLSYDCTEASKIQYVLLTVTDGNGSTSTSVAQVTVNPPPTASFTLNTSTGTVGTNVTATGTNLSGATGLTVNGTAATISNLTATGFTFVVPTGATSGNVVLTLPCGQTPGVAFTVQTVAPVLTTPANNSLVNTTTPTFSGTAPAGSTVAVYVDGNATPIGTTVATGGTWSLAQPTALTQGSHTVRATAQATGQAVSAVSNTNTFTVDSVLPTVTLSSATVSNNGATTTSPVTFTAQFSESVGATFTSADIALSAGSSIASFTANSSPANSYTFTVTPAVGSVSVNIAAGVAQDAAGNGNSAATPNPYTFTYSLPSVAVQSVTGLTPSPTATAQVNYRVVFSNSVSGLSPGNFNVTTTGSVSGASVASVSGSGTTYTVTVNTGTGDGTLRLDVNNGAGVTPGPSNVPYTSGTTYTITKSFPAAPTLAIVGTGGTGTDATAFVDVVQVLSGGTAFANGLQNSSFETHGPYNNGSNTFSYGTSGAVWAFNARAGISDQGSAFTPVTPIPNGIAVAFVQSNSGGNGQLQQNLAVPTGSNYQVSFQAAQRLCCTTLDQALNVFLNGVFLGNIQPRDNGLYQTFTSASFNVTAPALTASISSSAGASGSTTGTSPIPFTVTFSQAVTGFDASDVTVTNGTVTGGTVSGSGATYTFSVTPTANGLVTVNVPASAAVDANNTGNSSAPQFSITYAQPVTAAPVVTAPANGSLTNNATPTYLGTAPAGSTVAVYVDGNATPIGTTPADGAGAWSLAQPTDLTQGSHTVRATAQSPGAAVSASSATITFTVDSVPPTVDISSAAGPSGSSTGTTPIPFTVRFLENVTGFVAGDVTVINGTITGGIVNGTSPGSVFTFTVTPTTPGTPTTVNVPANVAQDAAGNGNTAATAPYSLTYIVPVTAVIWNGSQSTDWYTAANWTPNTVPTISLDATIPASTPNQPFIGAGTAFARNLTLNTGATLTQTGGTLDVRADLTNNGTFRPTGGTVVLGTTFQTNGPNLLGSGAVRFWDLTVNPNGVLLSTSAGASVQHLLTMNGAFVTQGNTFTLESNAMSTALVVNNPGGFVFGTATVQRYLDPNPNFGLGYRHYSSPVVSTTVADLATSTFTPVVNQQYNTVGNTVTTFPTVFGYDESRVNGTNATTQGFDQGFFSPATLGDQLTVGRGYTVNIDAASKVDLTGALNNGTVGVGALSRGTEANSGWHLLGNPYPAPLDWSVARTSLPAGVIDAVYVFKSSSQYAGIYQFYQNGFGTLPNGLIGSMQGFFVRVSQTVPTFNFLNAWRSTTYQNPAFNRTATDLRPSVQLELVSAQGARDAAFVYFEQGATAGLDDHYDAAKLLNTTGLNLASVVAVGQNLAVNGLPPMGTSSLTVPLSIGLPATGTYTLHAAQLLNFGSGEQPFLRDLQLGTLTDLSLHPDYAFTMNAANHTPRFELVFGPAQVLGTAAAALAAQVAVFPNPASKAVFVELPAAMNRKAVTAALLDALGRVVTQQVLPAGLATHTLPLTGLATGVYSLRLQTEAGVVVKKLVVE
ncbi:Ig-like domain-containing protein [Hymenobacter ruricola]|uniref:T9SS type A sorting domain-containing protein n=1 Tax=Hymenobacter ruricola TaxID=2791023 RepID=A0ABS0I7Q5_9BACT|nr:Ig-like domain-containing protein [Hymenobacter ruricola]MBF9222993.1 T9SS type A sorting domain-containing protein [Hymenobacter ruricola]